METSQFLLTVRRFLQLLLTVLVVGCGSPTVKSPAVSNVQTAAGCEIIYSPIPHKTTGYIVGAEPLADILALDDEQKIRFFRSVIPITAAITSHVEPIVGTTGMIAHEEVVGGYEAETVPSLSIAISDRSEIDYEALLQISALIGWVYVQDSVLVQCPDDGVENSTDATNLVVQAASTRDEFGVVEARKLYSKMIELAGNAEGLGYTFYPSQSRFESLESSSAPGTNEALIRVAILQLNDADIKFDFLTEPVEVMFPHNSWSVHRNGQAYLKYIDGKFEMNWMLQMRQRYLQTLIHFVEVDS